MHHPPPVIRIARADQALFISDMHLDDHDPALCAHVLQALESRLDDGRHPVQALFLLGDLFEYWVGDDVASDCATRLTELLQAFAASGGRNFIMHGNRDFLMDVPVPGHTGLMPFSHHCASTLLADPSVIEVAGERVLLSHGDLLCTDDKPYQAWRTQCRQPAWQQALLGKPAAERVAMAQMLRQQSHQQQAMMGLLTDVNQDAVNRMMDEAGCDRMIHGHTHRPALHGWTHDGRQRQRWVLSDWAAGEAPRGAVMTLAEGFAQPETTAPAA
ncbi:MAG: UDP-2,3-diacylglucosamine diphosphatase [Lautropia sp.]|nr:UDP-2,3-diacylglucosamine diphosphatase [Lautropia sp.]